MSLYNNASTIGNIMLALSPNPNNITEQTQRNKNHNRSPLPPPKKNYVQIWLPRVPGQAVGRRREWEVDGDDKGSAGRDRGRCRGRTLHDGPAILGGGFSDWDDIFKV